MPRALLIALGVVNLLFAFFHLYLGYEIHQWVSLPEAIRGFMQGLNAAGVLLIFFLAFGCLARPTEMLTTGLGAAILALGALLYLLRASEEFFWFSFKPAIFFPCVLVGLLHAALLSQVRLPQAE